MPSPEIKVKQLDNRRPSLLIRILAFRNNPIIKANRPNVRIKKKIKRRYNDEKSEKANSDNVCQIVGKNKK